VEDEAIAHQRLQRRAHGVSRRTGPGDDVVLDEAFAREDSPA
jgi:hypothetical protein